MDTNDSQVQDMAILNQKSKIHISLPRCGSSQMKCCDHRKNKSFEVFSSVSANWTKLGKHTSTNQVKANTASLKKKLQEQQQKKGETLVRLSQINHKTSRVRLCTKTDRLSINQQYRRGRPAHPGAGAAGRVSQSLNG